MKNPVLFLLLLLWSCTAPSPPPASVNSYCLIPMPSAIIPRSGEMLLHADCRIIVENNGFTNPADFLRKQLNEHTGHALTIEEEGPDKDAIVFRLNDDINHPEGYRLTVSPYDVLIEAAEPAGAFYAVQTLLQLLSKDDSNNTHTIAGVHIEDAPRYSYRGMHLDVCRHFFPVSFIKKYIDLLAMHKLNRFHWHLTEDQGWRIEIKQYPKLQEVAAYRKETLVAHYSDQPHQFDGQRYGGYYTQEEVRDIVAYAQERYITVIPEIEMPGHSLAALAAYPELGCTDGPFEVATKWGVFEEVYCPKEETFTFLENVLTEVMALFPSEYIHIGGDECPKTAWKNSAFCQKLMREKGLKDENELQSYFIRRIEKFLNGHGRQIIGWDEILEGGLAPNATVMSWRGTRGGIEAARSKHPVIMTPTSHCYFDYYQSRSADEPLAIGGFLPLKKVYQFEPTPEELTEEEASYILGAQGNVWTEYIRTPEQVEYMAFPRAVALAEVNWSPSAARDYDDFAERLAQHLQRLDRYDVHYANHLFEVNHQLTATDNGLELRLNSRADDGKIYYTLDGHEPGASATPYEHPIPLTENTHLKTVVYKNGKMLSRVQELYFRLHKAVAKNIVLTKPPHPSYNMGGKSALVNGLVGSDDRYGDGEWLGWSGDDFEAVIDLGSAQAVSRIGLRFYNGNGQWIYLPREVEVLASPNGRQFRSVVRRSLPPGLSKKVVPVVIEPEDLTTRYLKIRAVNHGVIAEGRQGAGHAAWLFVDEVVVE